METILAQQLVNDTASIRSIQQVLVDSGNMQVEQLFEIESLLSGIKQSIDINAVELFSIIDDSSKMFAKVLMDNRDSQLEASNTFEIVGELSTFRTVVENGIDEMLAVLTHSASLLEMTMHSLTPNVATSVLRSKSTYRAAPQDSDEDGYKLTKEDFLEADRETKRQGELLQEIADNTKGMVAPSDKNDGEGGMSAFFGALAGSGFMGKAIRGFGVGLLALFSLKSLSKALGGKATGFITGLFGEKGMLGNFSKAIKSVFANKWVVLAGKILKPFTFLAGGLLKAIFAPITLMIGAFIGLFDAVEEYSENGDLIDAVKAFFGGLINFLTFGIISKDFSLNEDGFILGLVADLGKWVREKVIEPLVEMWVGMVGWLDELGTEIEDGITNMGKAVRENIIDPIVDKFKGIVDFVIEIKDKLFGIFENMEIPKISFKIPWTDKEFSAGPWYPFKPKASVEPTSTPSTNYGPVVPSVSPTVPKYDSAVPAMVTPPATEKVAWKDTAEYREARAIIEAAQKDTAADILRKPNKQALPLPPEPKDSDILTDKSMEVSDQKSKVIIMPSTNVVSAPTTNNVSNTTNHIRVPVRNSDSTLKKYTASTF